MEFPQGIERIIKMYLIKIENKKNGFKQIIHYEGNGLSLDDVNHMVKFRFPDLFNCGFITVEHQYSGGLHWAEVIENITLLKDKGIIGNG